MSNKKVIGLFGGSFNPPHEGHLQAALYAHKALALDELWLLVTPANPLKKQDQYAPLQDRVEMCLIMARPYRDWLRPTDIEDKLNTQKTADTLQKLSSIHKDKHFVWIMGADNLKNFHKWNDWKHIIDNYSIAVLSRAGLDQSVLNSPAATYAKDKMLNDPKSLRSTNGWVLLDNKTSHAYHSSNIVKLLKNNRNQTSVAKLFNELSRGKKNKQFEQVASYVMRNQLYKRAP